MYNRRKFLLTSGAAGLSIVSNNISFGVDTTNAPDITPNENSVLYIFLSGGPTQIETFNPIPESTAERKSIVGHLDTNVAGIRIGGLWTELAQKANKFSIVNSFSHGDANHESATHWMMTGERTVPNSPPKWPSYGSVIGGQYGTNTADGLPTYIKLNNIQYDGAAWMGNKYMGYTAAGEGIKDLILKEKQKFEKKLDILKMIESGSRISPDNKVAQNWMELRDQAVGALMGKASEAFLIEKDAEFEDYKKDQLGKDFLTAIRLVERGVKFVTLNYGGWDMHDNIAEGMKGRVPALDHYISKYLTSMEKRQMNTRNMLVMSGDFGRTPKINKGGGRDHWPSLIPLFIACDGYNMGRTIGTSDANAERADQNPFEPEDLKWTMFDHLGINKTADWYSIENRPHSFVKTEAKNILKV